jgi:hypothetical protein
MSMKIKVTIPSVEFVQADSSIRRSLFKILEAGGTIPENDMMEVWRGLSGPVRCEWAVKMAGTIQLQPTHIQELQEHHKRSTKLQVYLFTSQKSLSDEETNRMFATWTEVVKRAFNKQLSTRWPIYGSGSGKLRRFSDSLLGSGCHYIDRLDEQTLYDLSSFASSYVAAAADTKLGNPYAYVPWFISQYIEMLSRGTRNSVLVPLLASPNQKISKLAESAYSKVAINSLDNSSILK